MPDLRFDFLTRLALSIVAQICVLDDGPDLCFDVGTDWRFDFGSDWRFQGWLIFAFSVLVQICVFVVGPAWRSN